MNKACRNKNCSNIQVSNGYCAECLNKFARPCRNKNCSNVATTRFGYCEQCEIKTVKLKEHKKNRWTELSRIFRNKHPVCERCGKPSQVVHHKIHAEDKIEMFFDINNLIALCRDCHERIHGRKV